MNTKFARAHSSASGFSLIELTFAITIFLVVSGSVFGLLQVARQSRTVVSENTSIGKNVRLALNLVGRDTYNAGYGYPLKNTVTLTDNRISARLIIPNDIDPSRDTVPPIIAGNNITLSTFSSVANTRTDQVTFLFKDTTFNLVPNNPVTGVSQPLTINPATTAGTTDTLTIPPLSGDNSGIRVNDILLITGASGSTLGVVTGRSGTDTITFANNDVLLFNEAGATGPIMTTTVAGGAIQRVKMVTYFVDPGGTLIRREFANAAGTNASVDEPLVYGVEDFQIIYIMDDGTNSNNPLAGPNGIAGDGDDTPTNLAAVRQIRFTVNVRSTERNAANQYYSTSMTSTFSTRNLGYDAN